MRALAGACDADLRGRAGRRGSRAGGGRARGDCGKKIIATVKVDKALLGGVVAELGGKIYDGSLATRLAHAQQRLAGQV